MLTGTRVRLRAPLERDLDVLTVLRNDAELQARLLAVPRPSSPERVREWLARRAQDPHEVLFVVVASTTDECLGFCQLVQMDFTHGHAQLGLVLAEGARGRGYGAEALALLERYARDTLNLRKLVLQVSGENLGALRVYAREGYRTVGTLAGHFYHAGAYHDVVVMEKLL